ncbi:hypothetical protein L202_00987 [Cryptococcus amylolentus CBS 6039]|uniref:Uncharacterized protein n=1 Tax=Cryptococcus amylolentus CBS 6039 TaxID=1295533 RepID=A0A1E3I2X1_9TREE|nr:hypothetical protein L202_00987 [Cryptococcus amylolentus CBS 6039]ODN82695.1 hypothetical protein L202_00987 [Cryptococcus amylolentus CBS 6039]
MQSCFQQLASVTPAYTLAWARPHPSSGFSTGVRCQADHLTMTVPMSSSQITRLAAQVKLWHRRLFLMHNNFLANVG